MLRFVDEIKWVPTGQQNLAIRLDEDAGQEVVGGWPAITKIRFDDPVAPTERGV